jgi:hypothetical protein
MRKRWHLPTHLWEKVEEIFKSEFSSGRLDGISWILGSSVCVILKGVGNYPEIPRDHSPDLSGKI